MITFIKSLSVVLFGLMLYTTIETSLESSLVDEWPNLIAIPWMQATLIDFYINIAFIYVWVLFRETTVTAKVVWLVLLVTLGSMATAAYVFLQARNLRPGEGLGEMFRPRTAS